MSVGHCQLNKVIFFSGTWLKNVTVLLLKLDGPSSFQQVQLFCAGYSIFRYIVAIYIDLFA
jgi:hypothetical protein